MGHVVCGGMPSCYSGNYIDPAMGNKDAIEAEEECP